MKTDLIVALDVENLQKARDIVDKLYPLVKYFKVGSQLFTACGSEAVAYIRKKGAEVFLDLKFYDIPNTVASAIGSAVGLDVFMLTVHTSGGADMMKKAVAAAEDEARRTKKRRSLIVGVTVLTSQSMESVVEEVLRRAAQAKECGLDGVVCSVAEAAAVRQIYGEDFIIVTPGIRLPENDRDDQKRVATPAAAVAAGSNYVVVGRPILEASDPLAAAKNILREIKSQR
ncbi:MAG: orotidine-5'-phosphate decarboxylase [Candidatus Omnitrophica bacterium]|nr:orotidine-5'-phosphate decarboxylase [Candidatus Omnitrophota bacterium]